jgi:hypothetical protein
MFARVTLVPNELEGNVFCALLRTEGIDCFTRPTEAFGGPHEVVVVNDEDLERARELVAARR